ncbi:MAG: ATP-binding protein [Variovorax sp.]
MRATAAPLSSLRVLTILCIALPLIAFAAVGTYRYRQIRAETELRLDRALRIAHEHALKVLDTNETLLARVTDALGTDDAAAIKKREAVLHEQFRAMAFNKPQIQSVWAWDVDGRALASDRYFPVPADLDVSQRGYFVWHRDQGRGMYVSEPLLAQANGELFFNMSRGRYRADGSFAGVVSVSLFPSYFQEFHGEIVADEPGLAITMFRTDGAVISRTPQLTNVPSHLSATSPVMSRVKAGELEGSLHGVSSVDGRERLLAFSKLGDYPVFLGTGMDVAEIWKRWNVEMAWLAAFGLPPMIGLYLSARLALRRTRVSLETAERLHEETEARRRVEEALLQAQKLEALGRLTGGVAHDFNNALMVISSNLYLLKRKHPDAAGRYAESIGHAVDSAAKLTRQLLAFSRRQPLVAEHVDLRQKLPQMQDLLDPVLGVQIKLGIDAAPDTKAIFVDLAELELALLNLAINARDAMGPRGEFRLTAQNATGDLPPLLSGPMVLVEATDTGAGIAPELLDKVFEPFFTTKAVGQGTGLGLSQVYGLCQRAGGLATIHSPPGGGTTVRLFFPAAPQPLVQSSVAAPAHRSHLGLRVMLVEDNDEVAAALMPVLEAMGCTVSRFERAAPARDWLLAQTQRPDVLLSDVVMPGEMDGAALAQQARQAFPALRIILMTGYAEQIDSITREGFEVLPKPCSAEMLAEALARTTGQAL